VIFADTSIWIQFFRNGAHRTELEALVNSRQLVTHPCVVAELALGSLRNRRKTLADLDCLPQLIVVSIEDVRLMIEARRIYAKGIGLTDAHLLASCLATAGTKLWTSDRRLGEISETLGIRADLTHLIN
jgi:predicted nucleic acid-binding protein